MSEHENEKVEVLFLVGSGDIEELLASLPDDEEPKSGAFDPEGVEFISPRVPGRGTWSAKTGRRATDTKADES